MGLCRQGCRPVLWLFVLRWRWLEGGAGSKICNWSQSFSSEHSGEIQFLTLHFACQGATGLQGAASGWAAGPGAWAMPEGPQDGTQPLVLALQGWITLTLQRFVCSH